MPASQLDVLLTVVAVLDRLNIAYLIGGSFASSAHGLARATMDIDLVADAIVDRRLHHRFDTSQTFARRAAAALTLDPSTGAFGGLTDPIWFTTQ